MGGSQKSIGQGKDGAITNPIRQKPYRRNGLQRKCQHKIPVPKSEENDAITNSLLKYAKNQTIHKAVRSPTHYLQRSKGWIYSQGGAITYPLYTKESDKRHLHKNGRSKWQETLTPTTGGKFSRQPFRKRKGIQSFNIHKLSDTNGREIFAHRLSTKGEGFSLLTFTHLVIPAALPPITSLGVIRGPITFPRGTTTRRRTFC